ncbi:MAG: hypothetical protein P8M49_05400 [Thalassotalea sp.]|nr:hypothetical protein [Thalassotalea sp.]MDG2392926.1 hypothetical protein [Thalassotalea sp.]
MQRFAGMTNRCLEQQMKDTGRRQYDCVTAVNMRVNMRVNSPSTCKAPLTAL